MSVQRQSAARQREVQRWFETPVDRRPPITCGPDIHESYTLIRGGREVCAFCFHVAAQRVDDGLALAWPDEA